MKKSIVTTVAFMLFALAGFAQGNGERVYIRLYNGLGYTEAHILENGIVTKKSLPAIMKAGERPDNLKELGNILETYYAKGFEVKAVTNLSTGASVETLIEYILQKD